MANEEFYKTLYAQNFWKVLGEIIRIKGMESFEKQLDLKLIETEDRVRREGKWCDSFS